MSPKQTSQIYFRPPSVPFVIVFFRITPIPRKTDPTPLSLGFAQVISVSVVVERGKLAPMGTP